MQLVSLLNHYKDILMKKLHLYIAASLMFITSSFSANADATLDYLLSLETRERALFPLNEDGHFNVNCSFDCNIHEEFKYVFSFYDTFMGEEQVFNFYDNGVLVETITLKEYFDEYYPNAERIDESQSKNITTLSEGEYLKQKALDGGLECQYDPDFTC